MIEIKNLNVSLEIMIAGAKGENIEDDDDLDKEIALLEQRLKIADNKLENKIENLSISLIDLIDSFYLSQSKFKKLYKFYDFKFYINDELFDFDRNKILNYFSDSVSKKNVYLEIYLIYNFSSFFEWEDNDVNYSVNLEIEFKQNSYSITINQEVILEKEQLQHDPFKTVGGIVNLFGNDRNQMVALIQTIDEINGNAEKAN